MGSFPYYKKFEPIVHEGDYIKFLPTSVRGVPFQNGTKSSVIYQVMQVEQIPQYMVDFLQVNGALPSGATTVAAGGQSNVLSPSITDFKNIFALEQGIFGQWRLDLLDDYLLSVSTPGATNYQGATEFGLPLWSRRLPQHKATTQFTSTSSITVPTLIWQNTASSLIAAQLTDQIPVRKSRIVGLAIYASTAMTIYFKDGTSTSSTIIGAQNFAVPFSTKDFIFLGRDSIPDELYFDTGILVQTDTAALASVTVVVEEDNTDLYSAQTKEQGLAQANNVNEFFTWYETMPTMRIWNPLQISISTARAMLGGWQFGITPSTSTSGVKPIGIPLYRIPRGGTTPQHTGV